MKSSTAICLTLVVVLTMSRAFTPAYVARRSTKQQYLTTNKQQAFKSPTDKWKDKIKAVDDSNEKESEYDQQEQHRQKMEEGLTNNVVEEAFKSLQNAIAKVNEVAEFVNGGYSTINKAYDLAYVFRNEINNHIGYPLEEDANDRLNEVNDRLEKAREFYLKLRESEPLTSSQQTIGKRKLTDIRDELIAFDRVNMGSDSLPITLMHPVFAEFVQNCQRTPTKEGCQFANYLRRAMLQNYKSVDEKSEAARNILREYLGLDNLVVDKDNSESNGSYSINRCLVLNLKVTTQSGEGSDPSKQNLAYFIKKLPIGISRQLPCLLLDISGPLFGVYGAMNTDEKYIIWEPLCPILPLDDADNMLIKPLVSRVCSAVHIAIKSLENLATTKNQRGLSKFPYKTSVRIDGETVTFRYLKRIRRYVFLVECTGRDGLVYEAIAKFAKTYGREVHQYCAESGFAPKLLAYEKLPADWHFVLMENIEMEPISKMDGIQKKEQLNDILQSLRSQNLVHGNLSRNNVLWNQDQNRVILIDFDWSGTNGINRYPCDLNAEVTWPDGSLAGEFILLEHDEFSIKQFLD